MSATKQYRAYAYILFAAFGWGCIGIFSRAMLSAGFSSDNIAAISKIGAMLVLALYLALRDRSVFRIRLKHLPIFFGTGVISVAVFTVCYFRCQAICSLAVSAILLYTSPAMVALMSAVVFREKLTKRTLAALLFAMLGSSFAGGILGGGLSVTAEGLLYGLASGFFYALYSIFGRFALRHYPPITVVMWTFLFASLGFLPMLDLGELSRGLAVPGMWVAIAALVLFSNVLAYLFYTRGLALVESSKASILASFEPVVASFVGILVFGEPFSLPVLLGLGCILLCVYILR